MIFIIFDIEIVFLYPFAVIFKQLHTFGLVEVLVFAVVVLVSFLYLVSNGALQLGPRPSGCGWGCPVGRRSRPSPGSRPRHCGPARPPRDRHGSRGPPTQFPHRPPRGPGEVGPLQQRVAGHLRVGLLRHRDDVRRRRLRTSTSAASAWRSSGFATPGRPHDRRRAGLPEDGARCSGQVYDQMMEPKRVILDGRLRIDRRHVQQLRDRPGRSTKSSWSTCYAPAPAVARDAAARILTLHEQDPALARSLAGRPGPTGSPRASAVAAGGSLENPDAVRVATPEMTLVPDERTGGCRSRP